MSTTSPGRMPAANSARAAPQQSLPLDVGMEQRPGRHQHAPRAPALRNEEAAERRIVVAAQHRPFVDAQHRHMRERFARGHRVGIDAVELARPAGAAQRERDQVGQPAEQAAFAQLGIVDLEGVVEVLTQRRTPSTTSDEDAIFSRRGLRCLSALCAHGTRQKTQRCRKFDPQRRQDARRGASCRPSRYLLAFSAVLGTAMSGMATDTRAQENLDRGQSGPKLFAASCVQCHKSARGLAKGRMSFTLSYYLRQHYTSSCSVGGYAHRLPAIGRHAARQGESRREEIAGGQGAAEGRGQGRNEERNNERAGVETADRHDQRRSARQTAGEDPGAIIAANRLDARKVSRCPICPSDRAAMIIGLLSRRCGSRADEFWVASFASEKARTPIQISRFRIVHPFVQFLQFG